MEIYWYLCLSLLLQFVFFIPAYLLKTDKLTDMSYCLTFIIISFIGLIYTNIDYVKLFGLLMIVIWAIRLGTFLVIRVFLTGRDRRFDSFRHHLLKFLGFFLFQGILAILVILPVLFILDKAILSFNNWSLIGGGIFLVGIIIETIADRQKLDFKLNPINDGKWIQEGLWKYVRHPNYSGEILCWLGVFVYSIPYFNIIQLLISLVSPIIIIVLLLFYTGIPILEKRANKKWGTNSDYKNYIKNTKKIIPFVY